MEVDFQVIKRYLEGRGQEGDKELIVSWFSDLRYEQDLRKQYRRYWDEIAFKDDIKEYDSSKILGRIYHEMKLEESRQLKNKDKKVLSRFVTVLSRVAAVLFIPLLILFLVNKYNGGSSSGQTAYSKIFSPPGVRTMFYLPDGSKGWLNGGSYLSFPVEFKGKKREVTVSGEAYFDVRSDKKKPFVVRGSGIEVVAYGTEFNVMDYPEDRLVKVTLAKGSVKVSGQHNGRIQDFGMLKPDQMCICDLKTQDNTIIAVDAAKIISWKDGKLIFHDDPFVEVADEISRWYNVNLVIKDEKLKVHRYMATFENETLDEVLKLLKMTAPIEYKDLGREKGADGTFNKRIIEIYYKPKIRKPELE